MSERVTVSPESVRGLGDIVSPKTTDDFKEYFCNVTEDNGVYTLVYDDTMSYLSLSGNPTVISYGESTVLTATLIIEGEPASGETVSFYDTDSLGSEGVLIGSVETGSDGKAVLTKSNFSIGLHYVKAVYDELFSGFVGVTVNKITPTISLSSDKSALFSGESFTLSGVLSVGSGETVKLYDNNSYVKDLTTGTGGAFSETITNASSGDNNYKVVFEGNTEYESVTSTTVNVFVIDGDYIELEIVGNSFSTYSDTPLSYTGRVFVDWDDGNIVEYTGGILSHTYSTSDNYLVKLYGNITGIAANAFIGCTGLMNFTLSDNVNVLAMHCFENCTGLTSVTLPNTVGAIGSDCFKNCTGLTEIVLEWTVWDYVPYYDSTWITGCTNFDHFLIPQGTKLWYTNRGYPSSLLKEVGSVEPASVDLTGTKSILSYADSESSVLTATVLDDNDDPVEGVDVNLYNGATLWDTLTTDSSGECSKTYSSAGVGDITFTAEVDGTLLTKTFVIYDYWKYDSSVHSTSSEVVNWDLPNGDFEITAYIGRGTGGAFIQLVDGTTSDRVIFGHAGSNNDCYLYSGSNYWTNGSGNNTDHTLKIINGIAYYTVNGNTISQNAPTGLTHKLYQFAPWGNSKISNIRIKPL